MKSLIRPSLTKCAESWLTAAWVIAAGFLYLAAYGPIFLDRLRFFWP